MPWIKFTDDFDFEPAARKGHVTIAYKAGMVKNVTRECLEAALAAGRAKRVSGPGKAKADENRGS